MDVKDLLSELKAVETQVTSKSNDFLALFGQSHGTLDQLDSVFKRLPPGLSLAVFNKVPHGESLEKAIALQKTLAPLVLLYKNTLDGISDVMDSLDGDGLEDLKEQLQRGDLFSALLDQYFGFLWNQLDFAAQREAIATDIGRLEKGLLALEINEDLKLAVNQYLDFPKTAGNRKRARAAVVQFMDKYEQMSNEYRTLNSQIFDAYDVQRTPPWFLLDDDDPEIEPSERDYWRKDISDSMRPFMKIIQNKFEKLSPQRKEDGTALYHKPEVSQHLNLIHSEMQKWDFNQFLEPLEIHGSKLDDLSLKNAAITKLTQDCQRAADELNVCLLELDQTADGIDPTLLPSIPLWVEATYNLENLLDLCEAPKTEASTFIAACISTNDQDFRCLDPLGESLDQLKAVYSRANRQFKKVRDIKRGYENDQLQNAKSSNFLERTSLPEIPRQPWRSAANFACWYAEIRDLIQSRRANDKISLRSLRQACKREPVAFNLLRYVESYPEAMENLRESFLPQTCLGPEIVRRIYEVQNQARDEREELKAVRLFLSCFQQLVNLDLKVGASLGLPILYHIVGSLQRDSAERFEEQSIIGNYEELDIEEHFEHLKKYLKFLVLKRQRQSHKANLRRMQNQPSSQSESKDNQNLSQPNKKWTKTWSKNTSHSPTNGSTNQSQQRSPKKCWYCTKEGCYMTKCQLLSSHLINKPNVYEIIKSKGLCLACMSKIENNPSGQHECQLLKTRPGRPVFNVLCERQCKHQGILLNRAICRCRIKKLKDNRSEIANSTVESSAIVLSSSNSIRVNGILLGSSTRASESVMVKDSNGDEHSAMILYDTGGSTSISSPEFSESSHAVKQDLQDFYTLVTETSSEDIPAILYSFDVVSPDGTTRFEALGGSSFKKNGRQVFSLLNIPTSFQDQFQLPPQYEVCREGHDITLGCDAQDLMPIVIASYGNVTIGLSQLTKRYIAWSKGQENENKLDTYERPGLDGHFPPPPPSKKKSRKKGKRGKSNHSNVTTHGTSGLGNDSNSCHDQQDLGHDMDIYYSECEEEVLAKSIVNNASMMSSAMSQLSVNPELIHHSLLMTNKEAIISQSEMARPVQNTKASPIVISHQEPITDQGQCQPQPADLAKVVAKSPPQPQQCNEEGVILEATPPPTLQANANPGTLIKTSDNPECTELEDFIVNNFSHKSRICKGRICRLSREACAFLHQDNYEQTTEENFVSDEAAGLEPGWPEMVASCPPSSAPDGCKKAFSHEAGLLARSNSGGN